MKSIRNKILFYTIVPFFVVYTALSAFIVYQVYRLQIREAERDLHNQAIYSASNLQRCFDIMELSAKISARELETIDPNDPAAREQGENILTTRFHNPLVVNVWLAFEPNAFDGIDSLHVGEYSGAPSGRYIRSYFRDGDSWITVDDMDESTLDNMEDSFFYVIPKETGTFFTSLGVKELLWDYGFGPIYVFCVSEPVFRDGKPIGCVGLDAIVNEETMGNTDFVNSVSAIFLADGRLCYFQRDDDIGKTLEELGFENSIDIMELLKYYNEKIGFHFAGYSGLTGVNSFNHFYPVEINGNTLYIYTSIPQRIVFRQIIPVLLPISSSFVVCLIVFSLLFMYFSKGIATPLKKLTEVSENIGSGNLQMMIDVINTQDEMGMISRSLVRMAEQFRTNKLLLERYYDRFDILLRIHYALFRSSAVNEAFNMLLSEVSGYYDVSKASFIFVIKDEPKIVAMFPLTEKEDGESEFFAHSQIVKLLGEKKHLTMNGRALEKAQLPFIEFTTKSLCILPLRVNDILRGYIIMEGKNQETVVHDDTTLLFLGDVLSYLISSRLDWEQEIVKTAESPGENISVVKQETQQEFFMERNDDTFLERAKSIQNLDVDKGILLIGGEKNKYTELLKVTIKVISDSITKLRRYCTEDIPAFAIEVHGMKSALFGIGAEVLGEEARQLEFAAKSDDDAYCRDNYPVFEEKLRVLSRNLAALFPQQERSVRKGEIKELKDVLLQAKEACDTFDVAAAISLLTPLASLNWDNETIQKGLQDILSDMENLEYEGVAGKILELLEFAGNAEK